MKYFDVGVEAYGWIAIGQRATGFIAIGQAGLGVAYGAGMIGIGGTAGGWIPLAAFGRIPLRQVVSGRMTDITVWWDVRPWKVVVMAVVSVVALAVIPLWDQVLSRL